VVVVFAQMPLFRRILFILRVLDICSNAFILNFDFQLQICFVQHDICPIRALTAAFNAFGERFNKSC